jgi:hypothetical protein
MPHLRPLPENRTVITPNGQEGEVIAFVDSISSFMALAFERATVGERIRSKATTDHHGFQACLTSPKIEVKVNKNENIAARTMYFS